MQNLYQPLAFINPIVNPNRRVKDLSDVGTLRNHRSDVRKLAKELHMIENGDTEVLGRGFAVAADVVENVF